LLGSFEGEPNNVLVAQLLTGRRGKVSDEADNTQTKVITGSAAIPIPSRVSAARRSQAEETREVSSSSRTLASRLRAAD